MPELFLPRPPRSRRFLAKAEHPGKYGAVLFVDIGNFNPLNDTLDHDMDHRLLEMAALRLQLVAREADAVVRLGVAEFVVLLGDQSDALGAVAASAETMAHKLREILSLAYQLDGREVRSTPGIDVVEHSEVV